MERVYQSIRIRKKAGCWQVFLKDLGWSITVTKGFEERKAAITAKVTLAHRDPSKRLSIYTEANENS